MSEPNVPPILADARAGGPQASREPGESRAQIEAAIEQRLRQRSRRNRRIYLLIRIVSLIIVLAAWQYYGSRTTAVIFDPLTRVLGALVDLFRHHGLGSAIWYSVWTFAIGYTVGVAAGVALGMCLGAYRRAEPRWGCTCTRCTRPRWWRSSPC